MKQQQQRMHQRKRRHRHNGNSNNTLKSSQMFLCTFLLLAARQESSSSSSQQHQQQHSLFVNAFSFTFQNNVPLILSQSKFKTTTNYNHQNGILHYAKETNNENISTSSTSSSSSSSSHTNMNISNINTKSPSSSILQNRNNIKSYYPPWLPPSTNTSKNTNHNSKNKNTNTSTSNNNNNNDILEQSKAKYNLYNLRQKLHLHHHKHSNQFSMQDVTTVINAIFVSSQNDMRLISSCSVFISLLLDLEEDYSSSSLENNDNNKEEKGFMFMTKDTLVASAFHYCDCINARNMGLYDMIHSAMRSTNDKIENHEINDDSDDVEFDDIMKGGDNKLFGKNDLILGMMMPYDNDDDDDIDMDSTNGDTTSSSISDSATDGATDGATIEISSSSMKKEGDDSIQIQQQQNRIIAHAMENNQIHTLDIASFGSKKAEEIYLNVSRLKRVEIMSHALLPQQQKQRQTKGTTTTLSISKVTPSPEKAASLRGLLLTMSDGDWHSLAIRLAASLYRLRGIVQYQQETYHTSNQQQQQHLPQRNILSTTIGSNSSYGGGNDDFGSSSISSTFDDRNDSSEMSTIYNQEMIREAREALQVYVPLAQRLGMTKLKTELENLAFRILYKRQYVITKSLYYKFGGGMGDGSDDNLGDGTKRSGGIHNVATFLKTEIESMLHSDPWLMDQLDRMTVMVRVKEPYSLWKKILKMKKKDFKSRKKEKKNIAIMGNVGSTNKLEGGFEIHDKESTIEDDDNDDVTSVKMDYSRTSFMTVSSVQQKRQEFMSTIPSISLVQDAIALRVVIKAKSDDDFDSSSSPSSSSRLEEFLCYYIQNILMKSWPVVDESRIKDYISQPKPNGYQSLHHTSFVTRFGQQWPFEVQIRTEDMHTKSEFGVAAHWDYKLKGSRNGKIEKEIPQSHRSTTTRSSSPFILPPDGRSENDQEDNIIEVATTKEYVSKDDNDNPKIESMKPSSIIESYISALDTARSHLLQKSVFIFFLSSSTSTSAREGKVLGIPVGSTVADAIIEVCTRCQLDVPDNFESSDIDVYVNGKLADLHEILKTGDTLIFPGLDDRVVRYML